jgi:hypothetical protein
MQNTIIEFRNSPDHQFMEIEEAINDSRLLFHATSLESIGFDSLYEINDAVQRAITICCDNGVAVNEHFKPIYISDNDTHTLRKDWKLSKLAYTLAILYGAPGDPRVQRLQFEILKQFVDHEEHK